MRITGGPRHRAELVVATFRGHRLGIAAWAVAVGGVFWWFGTLFEATVSGIPGGPRGFAATMQASADAMRALTGPAERLDTYGGYASYHNFGYLTFFLALYAVIQGARAVRGEEERGFADEWLATGMHRRRVVRDRWLGFAAALLVVTAGVGTGTALGAVAAGQPDWAGAYLQVGEVALTALVFYSLALLVSQLTTTARAASGITSFVMLGLYLVNNLATQVGAFAWLRWLSPFAYQERSRAFVPGIGVSLWATAVLVATAVVLGVLAALAYERRDCGSGLWARRRASGEGAAPARIRLGRLGTRDLWVAWLRDQRLALSAWFLSTAVLMMLYVSVGSGVVDTWMKSDFVRRWIQASSTASFTDQFVSLTVTLMSGLAVAFVVVQAARWVGDIGQRREEMALANGVSRLRLVMERALALLLGVLSVVVGAVAGIVWGALVSGQPVAGWAVVRTALDTLLLAGAVGGVSLLVVSWFRSGFAVALLSALLGASWLIVLFAGVADWPDWLLHASLFDAYGRPYLETPGAGGLIYLAALAVGGTAAAVAVSRLRSAAA